MMRALLLVVLTIGCAHVPREPYPTTCAQASTDAEVEALCAPCTPADAADELGGNWTCERGAP